MKKFIWIAGTFALLTGCGSWEEEDSEVKLMLPENDPYSETFRQLNLGYTMVLGYEFREPEESMIYLNAAHYLEGELQEEVVAEFGFGGEEGELGLGIINPGEAGEMFSVFSNVGSSRHAFDTPVLLPSEEAGMVTWSTVADNDQEMELQAGEKEIIAVFRQSGDTSSETLDITGQDLEQVIAEDRSVVVLTAEVREE